MKKKHFDINLNPDQVLHNIPDGRQRAALWYKSTYERINNRYYKGVRYLSMLPDGMNKANELITEYNTNVDKIWNDKTHVKIDHSFCNDYFEPIDVSKQKNVTTLTGIEVYVLILANKSVAFPNYFASGISNIFPYLGQDHLYDENARVSMATSGWLQPAGNILRQGGIFITGFDDALLAEFGSFNDSVAGTLFFRVVLETPLQHIQNVTYYTASHETEFRPG